MMRTFRQALVGATLQTPPLHFHLTRVVPKLAVSNRLISNKRLNSFGTFSMRMAAHMILVMPYMQASIFFGIGTLKYLSIQKGIDFMQLHFIEGVTTAACFWPIVMTMLYTFVPVKYGNLFMDSFNLIWAIILSFLANKKPHHDSSLLLEAPIVQVKTKAQ